MLDRIMELQASVMQLKGLLAPDFCTKPTCFDVMQSLTEQARDYILAQAILQCIDRLVTYATNLTTLSLTVSSVPDCFSQPLFSTQSLQHLTLIVHPHGCLEGQNCFALRMQRERACEWAENAVTGLAGASLKSLSLDLPGTTRQIRLRLGELKELTHVEVSGVVPHKHTVMPTGCSLSLMYRKHELYEDDDPYSHFHENPAATRVQESAFCQANMLNVTHTVHDVWDAPYWPAHVLWCQKLQTLVVTLTGTGFLEDFAGSLELADLRSIPNVIVQSHSEVQLTISAGNWDVLCIDSFDSGAPGVHITNSQAFVKDVGCFWFRGNSSHFNSVASTIQVACSAAGVSCHRKPAVHKKYSKCFDSDDDGDVHVHPTGASRYAGMPETVTISNYKDALEPGWDPIVDLGLWSKDPIAEAHASLLRVLAPQSSV